MTDEFEIQQLLNLYSEAASRGDFDTAIAAFTTEGVWEVEQFGLNIVGYDAIVAAQKNFASAMEYLVQMNAPAVITVTGDTATARSTIRECGKVKDKDELVEFLGFYTDALERSDKGWKFSKRSFHILGTHRLPTLAAEAA